MTSRNHAENSRFDLLPAIDLRGGRVVRLLRGDFDRETVYGDDPAAVASRFVEEGARWLHVVDLDGARDGRPVNLAQLERIASRAGVPVQFGGGLRTVEAVADAVGAGADRVVVGTVAFTEGEVLDGMVERAGERVWVAIDVRDGVVTTAGWLESTQTKAPDAAQALRSRGIGGLVYTSVDRDGTMKGPDTEGVVAASTASTPLIYSGGIGSLEDLRAIAALDLHGLKGVIVGKALYERRFSVAEAQRALEEGAA